MATKDKEELREARKQFFAKWSRSCRKGTQRRKIGFFRNPQSPLPKGAPPHPVVPHPQGRDKLKIAGTDDLQSFGIARKACALKGERCLLECP